MSRTKWYSAVTILIFLVLGIIIFGERQTFNIQNEVPTSLASNLEQKDSLAFIPSESTFRKVPDFSFLDQNGKTISNKDYLGKVYVVEFFFTSCPDICPIMNANLIDVQKEFSDVDNFGIASFTVDPTHDTPAVLKKYAEQNGISHKNWHLMTGNINAILDLANKGFTIPASVQGNSIDGITHSGYFALVDQNGFLRSRRDKFGNPIVFYQGSVLETQNFNDLGQQQDITILKEDIYKLLEEGKME